MDSLCSRFWFVTINNPSDEDIQRLEAVGPIAKDFVYQYEVGSSGTLHIHAYVEFVRDWKWKSVKKLFKRAHLEIPRNNEACRRYCMKVCTRVVPSVRIDGSNVV